MIKKVDQYYRILIPRDMMKELGIYKNTEVDIELVDNKITIAKHENASEITQSASDLVKNNTDIINNIEALDHGYFKFKAKDVIGFDGKPMEHYECSRCGSSTMGSAFKVNSKPICIHCFRDIKKQLLKEVKNGGRRIKS